jgi:hypothetical protein
MKKLGDRAISQLLSLLQMLFLLYVSYTRFHQPGLMLVSKL